ncbi:MAG: hypothetical protein DCF15_04710 [Phormidesmis priestleyi]|uniref:DUF86 domain-containing protein n=1 Tax=Phormidesmis priestleyi TaxID=268141 RepID=A0A2W4XMM7_9CYAN|nr:MAG: hypothetical protein DCF15_04710 [Phormidesmis priestleyi]
MSRDLAALVDISEAIQLINQYIEDVDRYDLSENVEKQDAIIRRITTIIGEATKRLSKEFRSQHPKIPWKQIAGMRDVLSHDYDEIDLDEVWIVVKQNLPQLLTYIQPLIPSE